MYLHTYILGVTQHPGNNTFCKGSNAVLSCVIFDNSTINAANTTGWFGDNSIESFLILPSVNLKFMISNTRDGDVVTSVLTIKNLLLNDSIGYICYPTHRVESYVGVISVAGM